MSDPFRCPHCYEWYERTEKGCPHCEGVLIEEPKVDWVLTENDRRFMKSIRIDPEHHILSEEDDGA